MVVKRKPTTRKPTTRKPAQKMQRYRIEVKHSFGGYKSLSNVTTVKKVIKSKLPKIVFSKPIKQRNGYKFTGRVIYTKSFNAPISVVRSAVKTVVNKSSPGAVVTVTAV